MANIRIEYDGEWPCRCMGHLKVWIEDTLYDFGKYVLISGGYIETDDDGMMEPVSGKWSIADDSYPKDFPENMKEDLISEINAKIKWGCCGGCI